MLKCLNFKENEGYYSCNCLLRRDKMACKNPKCKNPDCTCGDDCKCDENHQCSENGGEKCTCNEDCKCGEHKQSKKCCCH